MPNERQIPVPIEEEMRKSYLDYAMSVIVGRALPDIRDGLKPVHRRGVYALPGLGRVSNRAPKKAARGVGEVLGKDHPPADSPRFGAPGRVGQEVSPRFPPGDGLVMLVDDPETPIERLTQVIKGPDFPTRGYIYGTAGIADAYTTGRGTITLRAKAHAEKMRGGREAIIITELPYQVNKASLIEKIAELSGEKKIEGISEIRDESSREGIRVVLELGRGEIPQIIMNQLHKHTQMQTTFGIIMLALVDRRPQIVNLKQMLEAFVRFRREIVTRRTRFDLARAEERAHILAGLRKAVEHLDEVIRLIRQAESPDAAKDALMARLDLSEIQAKAILEMRLQRLTQLERHKVVEEHEQTLALIEELKGILASERKLMEIIRKELLALKEEYGDARRTEILTETTELTIEDLLADEEMVVTITRSGYIKRTHVEAYRSQRRGGKGVTGMETKEEDIDRQLGRL